MFTSAGESLQSIKETLKLFFEWEGVLSLTLVVREQRQGRYIASEEYLGLFTHSHPCTIITPCSTL